MALLGGTKELNTAHRKSGTQPSASGLQLPAGCALKGAYWGSKTEAKGIALPGGL